MINDRYTCRWGYRRYRKYIFLELGLGCECMFPDLDSKEFGKINNFESPKFSEEEKDKIDQIETDDMVRVVIAKYLLFGS